MLVHMLESQRFLVHPLFIPIVNLALLDKTIRAYLISHVAHVMGRGHALIYRVKPSQRKKKVYWYSQGEIYYRMFDNELCDKDTCLGCKELEECKIFRAQYERQKRGIQLERYEQGRDQAVKQESLDLTDRQLEDMLEPELDSLMTDKGTLDVAKMRIYLRDEHGVQISSWKAYQIKRNLELRFREKFSQ